VWIPGNGNFVKKYFHHNSIFVVFVVGLSNINFNQQVLNQKQNKGGRFDIKIYRN
jgi:hypothetical protein